MELSRMRISNFRCFGEDETVIDLNKMTGFIGHNSSGKTALLQALSKMFSQKSNDRNIHRGDFYIPNSTNPETVVENDFYIEVEFIFPELDDNDDSMSVPVFFNNFVVSKTNGKPYLRIRLEANWKKSTSPDGSIDSSIYFITTASDNITDEDKKIASRHDLDQIRLIYVPAIRRPSEQLKNVSGTIISRLLNGINWSDVTKSQIISKSNEVEDVFSSENGVQLLKSSLGEQWKKYHSDQRYSNAKINFNSTDLESILKKVEVKFAPTETMRDYNVEELGDGLRSLFYLTLVNTLLDIEQEILSEMDNEEDEDREQSFSLVPPVMTIVAIEEPENHISPHLLGRVIKNLTDISSKKNAQTILTSHTPAIIKRINPEDIRHFRMCKHSECTKVNALTLPDKMTESKKYKYVKEAVIAYPELYFASLVVLGEGDSEEIVLKKMLEINNTEIDSSGISIVPLGGRHVNHFWKLLNNLDIPYITLLDLDRERFGGGWGRIKYVIDQLIANGFDKEEILKTEGGCLTDDELSGMHEWDVLDTETMDSWINWLEDYDVYFSYPLDIDFALLKKFKSEYISILSNLEGPRIEGEGKISNLTITEENKEKYDVRIKHDIEATLKSEGGEGKTFTDEEKELMIWYNYFFLNRGKPTTHLEMFAELGEDILIDRFPECLVKLLQRIKDKINSKSQEPQEQGDEDSE